MGTWQVGPFDNDSAMDFFSEVEEMPDPQIPPRLRAALIAALERPGWVEADEGQVALAAASLVAAGRSRAADTGNPSVDSWLTAHRPEISAEDRRIALAALDRVTGPDSELMTLWAQSPAAPEAKARIESLRRVLES